MGLGKEFEQSIILARSLKPFALNFYIKKERETPLNIDKLREAQFQQLLAKLLEPPQGKKETKAKAISLEQTIAKEPVKQKEQISNLLDSLTKTSKTYSQQFYATIKQLYSVSPIFSLYKDPQNTASYGNKAAAAWQEYFSFRGYQETNFQFKKHKGGDPLLDRVLMSQVSSIDYEEEKEIQRVAKMGTYGIRNNVDPEAMERHKYWVLFSFNQIMSWFYQEFAI